MTMAGVRAKHPWLDSRMRIIGYAPIRDDMVWRDSRMLLGQAVHEVVKHLQLEPPDVLEITDSGLQSIQTHQRNGSTSRRSSAGSSSASAQVVDRSTASKNSHPSAEDAPPEYSSVLFDMPAIPQEIPELDSLTREELDDLLEDELDFTAFVNKLSIMKEIQSTANDILDENIKKAEANLEKMEKVKTQHKYVTELKRKLESKLENFKKLEQKQDALCAPPDMRDVLRQLTRGKKESFQESEQMAEEWVEDGTNVDAFVRDFVEKRKIHHIRAAKIERLQQQSNTKIV
jgi:ESCRT-I complex subunit VPS37